MGLGKRRPSAIEPFALDLAHQVFANAELLADCLSRLNHALAVVLSNHKRLEDLTALVLGEVCFCLGLQSGLLPWGRNEKWRLEGIQPHQLSAASSGKLESPSQP